MKKSLFVSVVALLVAIAALVCCYICCNKKVVATPAEVAVVEEAAPVVDVEAVLKEHPEYVVKAFEAYQQKLREEETARAAALIKDNEAALLQDDSAFVGPKDSKVVLVEFYDYACGYCKRLYPELTKIAAENTDLKVVYRPLAFVSQYSEYAARAVLAANEQGKFGELHTALFTVNKALSEEMINELAEKAGIDVEKMKQDMHSEKVNKAYENNNNLSAKIQVNGVPTVIMNGQMLSPDPRAITDEIAKARK